MAIEIKGVCPMCQANIYSTDEGCPNAVNHGGEVAEAPESEAAVETEPEPENLTVAEAPESEAEVVEKPKRARGK